MSDQPITPNDPEITKAAAVFYGGTLDGYGAVMDSLKGAQPSTVDYNASTKAQTEASAAARTILAKATDAKAQAEIDLNTKKFTNPAQAYTTYGLIRNSLAEGMRQALRRFAPK